MGSKREYSRVSCDSPCILDYDGNSYQVLLENISLGGALVKVSSDLQYNLHIGAICGLMLCSNPDMCPTKYTCRVARLDSTEVGMNFQKMDM